ncbi:hypothetical protein V6N13_104613 [Hibiscus sabdariffa]
MQEFSEFIDALNLIDPPLSGGAFTWSNFRERPTLSRLDQFLFSLEVFIDWSNMVQSLMPKSISDHNPIAISLATLKWSPKPFRWFDYWEDDKGIVESVHVS